MKIQAIYTLLTAVVVTVLPTQSPPHGIVPAELQSKLEQSEDRPFESFAGEPVPLAWETVAGNETVGSAAADTLSDKGDGIETLADDAASDDAGGFAAFGDLEGSALTSPTGADPGAVSEWDMVGALSDRTSSATSKLESLTTVKGILAEAASRFQKKDAAVDGQGEAVETASVAGEAETGEVLASANSVVDPDPATTSVSDATIEPDMATTDTATDPAAGATETETVPVGEQIVSDEEGFWIRSARLNDVFQYLARMGDLQYFHNSDLDAPNYVVTGHLRDGDPQNQMEELGLMYGVTIHRKGATVYAMTNAQLSQLPTKPFQYNLRYLRPTDIDQIKAILQTMLTPGSGIIEYEPKTNTLIIIDNEQKVDVVKEILADMDRPKQQIAIETRILRINTDSSNRIGVDWSSVLGEGLTIEGAESLNALFGLPDSDTVSEVISLTNTLATTATSAFDGESTYSETQGGNLLNGVLDGDVTGTATSGYTGTDTFGNSRSEGSDRSFTRNQSVTASGSNLVLSPVQLSATLRALNAGGLAQQESSPTLITEDNEQAIISIIDRIPIVTTTISETDAGQNITEDVRYTIDSADPTIADDPSRTREIGVSVAVTPTILPDNTIRMSLRPRSAQITDVFTGASGNVFPRVNESSVDTIARIPNGNSLLIGGFYEESETESNTKVPVLGDIPVLKFFFSAKDKSKTHTSLIFVVTPKLYEPTSPAQTLTTTREIHDRHVVPNDHSWPDRKKPGNGYEANIGWTAGNMVNAYDPIPPSNALHPEHPVNLPEGTFGPQERQTFAPQLNPAPRPKRRGLLNRLFNRDQP